MPKFEIKFINLFRCVQKNKDEYQSCHLIFKKDKLYSIKRKLLLINNKKIFYLINFIVLKGAPFEYNKIDVQRACLKPVLSAIGNDNKTIDQSLIPRTERTLTRVLIAEYISELGE